MALECGVWSRGDVLCQNQPDNVEFMSCFYERQSRVHGVWFGTLSLHQTSLSGSKRPSRLLVKRLLQPVWNG